MLNEWKQFDCFIIFNLRFAVLFDRFCFKRQKNLLFRSFSV